MQRARDERAARDFRAVVRQAEVQLVEGATHSLVTDLRGTFGRLVVEWLQQQG